MKKITTLSSLFVLQVLLISHIYAQGAVTDMKKEKEETVNWILQKLNGYVIAEYKMVGCDKPIDIHVDSHDNFTYDYTENCIIWSSDEVTSMDKNVHKISTRKFFIKYYNGITSSDGLVETVMYNSKCAKKHSPQMIHLAATANLIEVESFYYKNTYANQFNKSNPKIGKLDIAFKYTGEENLVARLDKALKHLKDITAPALAPASNVKKDEKF